MNTIRELKQQEKYKSMLKRKNKEKKIYKDKNASLQLEKQRLYIALRNKDKEIERLIISLQAQEELTMNWYNKVKKARDLFYEKCRISQNGAYIFNEVDYEELSNILGSDKE